MFDRLLAHLVNRSSKVIGREEGVAFFRVARDLYRVASISYFCINIPVAARRKYYVHGVYSDTGVMHCMSEYPVGVDIVHQVGLSATVYCEPQDWPLNEPSANGEIAITKLHALTFPLRQRVGESAVFGISAEVEPSEWEEQKQVFLREVRLLADYFHSHVLRMNGHNAELDILVSAKELDCLKWTAAGKTAWEASVILGISERTVRFHLNMAREKLNCATTTQAVAKAIVNQLIDI